MAAVEYLGIDVGGTGVKMGIVHSDTGQINNFQSYDTATWRESNHFLERLADAIALQLYQHKNVKKIGIGLPGILTKNRRTLIEITAIPELLRLVNIAGAIITIDAMGTQKAIAAQIIDQKENDIGFRCRIFCE